MKRDLETLATREFDLLIVGGGIYGICAAWDATLRGLSVALIERGDFSAATSANSFKVVHGGIRYLQHADLPRIRESSKERSALLRVAPHLVEPLPFVIPTFGRGMQGKGMLRLGGWVYDLLTMDRNRGIADHSRRIPPICSISREECLSRYPGLDEDRLTGAVVFHDAQVYNPPRLALSFLRAAMELGAVAANYVEATGFTKRQSRVLGVTARDLLSSENFEIRAKMTLNAAGAWVPGLLEAGLNMSLKRPPTFSRDACFVVHKRLLPGRAALAVQGRTKDPDALVSRSRRHLFVVPWRDYTLVGVWHVVHNGHPDRFRVEEEELRAFIEEINEAYPPLRLSLSDVSVCNAGLVLFGDHQTDGQNLSYGHRSRIIDHSVEHGLDGLISLIGVRYTTARAAAQTVIDLVSEQLGRKLAPCRTENTPVYGGDIEDFGEFSSRACSDGSEAAPREAIPRLVRNYGSAYQEVLDSSRQDARRSEPLGDSNVLSAEIVHAVRCEMAQKLSDVVCRRTDLATGACPPGEVIVDCADIMAGELGWDRAKTADEINDLYAELGRISTLRSMPVPSARSTSYIDIS